MLAIFEVFVVSLVTIGIEAKTPTTVKSTNNFLLRSLANHDICTQIASIFFSGPVINTKLDVFILFEQKTAQVVVGEHNNHDNVSERGREANKKRTRFIFRCNQLCFLSVARDDGKNVKLFYMTSGNGNTFLGRFTCDSISHVMGIRTSGLRIVSCLCDIFYLDPLRHFLCVISLVALISFR